jgi:ABC-type hemin transport system ATPase subunit
MRSLSAAMQQRAARSRALLADKPQASLTISSGQHIALRGAQSLLGQPGNIRIVVDDYDFVHGVSLRVYIAEESDFQLLSKTLHAARDDQLDCCGHVSYDVPKLNSLQ